MKITNPTNPRENWNEVLLAWNQLVNWKRNGFRDLEIKSRVKSLAIFIWNEKDWLKKEFPHKSRYIERYVDSSTYIKVVADLANALKHRGSDRSRRSGAALLSVHGQIILNNAMRKMYFIDMGNGDIQEVFSIIEGAIDEYEHLQVLLML